MKYAAHEVQPRDTRVPASMFSRGIWFKVLCSK
jgi:hypothetical protein